MEGVKDSAQPGKGVIRRLGMDLMCLILRCRYGRLIVFFPELGT
jgi:hypothetical protein